MAMNTLAVIDNNGDICMISDIIYLVVMYLCSDWVYKLVILHEYRVNSYLVRSKYMR